MAKSFSGTVSGEGIDAQYTVQNKGKKVCVDYSKGSSPYQPEKLTLSVSGGGKFKVSNPQKSSCKGDKSFAKELKKANKVKAKGKGPYGEKVKGTLT
jgi:hypothetical protein